MLQKQSTPYAPIQQYIGAAALVSATLLMAASPGWGRSLFPDGLFPGQGGELKNDRAIRLVESIAVPVSPDNNTAGAMYSVDISWVDQSTQTYYLADRSNKRVDIVDAKTNKFLGQINATPSFAGVSPPSFGSGTAGPNGVTAGGHCLFVTDAPSRVVSFDTASFPPAQISDVQTATPTPNRADELAYDPKDGLLLVINNADTPPFGTFIKVNKSNCALTPPTAANKITFDAAHGVDAAAGAEQPVWEPTTARFYLSIPQIGPAVSNGGVVRIAPNATKVEAVYPVQFCGPAGLTVGPRQDLFIGCNMVFDTAGNVWNPTGNVTAAPQDVIIDAKTGKKDPNTLDTSVPGVGAGDEVWYNSGDNNYYATGSGSPFRPLPAAVAQGSTPLGVVDARDQTVLQFLPTFNVPAVLTGPTANQHPAGTSHSVAANAANNHVLVPIPANNAFPDCLTGCIAVFAHPDEDRTAEAVAP